MDESSSAYHRAHRMVEWFGDEIHVDLRTKFKDRIKSFVSNTNEAWLLPEEWKDGISDGADFVSDGQPEVGQGEDQIGGKAGQVAQAVCQVVQAAYRVCKQAACPGGQLANVEEHVVRQPEAPQLAPEEKPVSEGPPQLVEKGSEGQVAYVVEEGPKGKEAVEKNTGDNHKVVKEAVKHVMEMIEEEARVADALKSAESPKRSRRKILGDQALANEGPQSLEQSDEVANGQEHMSNGHVPDEVLHNEDHNDDGIQLGAIAASNAIESASETSVAGGEGDTLPQLPGGPPTATQRSRPVRQVSFEGFDANDDNPLPNEVFRTARDALMVPTEVLPPEVYMTERPESFDNELSRALPQQSRSQPCHPEVADEWLDLKSGATLVPRPTVDSAAGSSDESFISSL